MAEVSTIVGREVKGAGTKRVRRAHHNHFIHKTYKRKKRDYIQRRRKLKADITWKKESSVTASSSGVKLALA
jgi:hypothetical protein